VALWINKMFEYFKPEIKEEIRTAKSKIYVLFNGWGSKHEKLSVISVVVHFINNQGDMVTCLIGLPELLNHVKAGVGKSSILIYSEHTAILFLLVVLYRRIRQFVYFGVEKQ
jgi:hypothetical protein